MSLRWIKEMNHRKNNIKRIGLISYAAREMARQPLKQVIRRIPSG